MVAPFLVVAAFPPALQQTFGIFNLVPDWGSSFGSLILVSGPSIEPA